MNLWKIWTEGLNHVDREGKFRTSRDYYELSLSTTMFVMSSVEFFVTRSTQLNSTDGEIPYMNWVQIFFQKSVSVFFLLFRNLCDVSDLLRLVVMYAWSSVNSSIQVTLVLPCNHVRSWVSYCLVLPFRDTYFTIHITRHRRNSQGNLRT